MTIPSTQDDSEFNMHYQVPGEWKWEHGGGSYAKVMPQPSEKHFIIQDSHSLARPHMLRLYVYLYSLENWHIMVQSKCNQTIVD